MPSDVTEDPAALAALLAGHFTATERTLAAAAADLAAAIVPVWRPDRDAAAAARARIATAARAFPPLLAAVPRCRNPSLSLRAERLRGELGRWPAVEALVRDQLAAARVPLVRPPLPPVAAAQVDLADAVAADLAAALRVEHDPGADAFADISAPLSHFLESAHAAARVARAAGKAAPRFLDVGCGAGTLLVAARHVFAAVAGVEREAPYAARARTLAPIAEIVETDALRFDGYGRFDVVHLFRPAPDEDAMAAIEAHVLGAVAPGTVVIAPYRGFARRHAAHGAAPLAGALYLAGASAAEAATLVAQAEHVGVAVRRAEGQRRGLWDGVLDASLANGFALRAIPWTDHV